jgi:hypothetical protein
VPPSRNGASPQDRGRTFVLRLRAEPRVSDPIRALRALLKVALRRFGLRCTDAVEVQPREEGGGP